MLAAALFTLILPRPCTNAPAAPRAHASARSRRSAKSSWTRAGPADAEGVRPERRVGRMLAERARTLSDSTFWVLGTTRSRAASPISACALGAAAALAFGA